MCALCPGSVLDPLGHHVLACSCQQSGDVVTHHNQLKDTLAEACQRVHMSVKVEAGSHNHSHSCSADILVPNWSVGKPAAFDLSVSSSLNSKFFLEAGLAGVWQPELVTQQAIMHSARSWVGSVPHGSMVLGD